MEPKFLTAQQVLLTTLVFKLAVMALLATMLVRYRRFRHILIFERRGLRDRLIFAFALGIPLAGGAAARVLLHYDAADLTLEGAFLVGLIGGPYAGAIVGAAVALPALFAGEFIALPFAVGCGFAGGGLRELCPKEAIWHFSPFVFSSLPRRVWQLFRRLEVDWQVVLLLAPVALELLRQLLGHRFGAHRLFYLAPTSAHVLLLIVLATVLCVAAPIKIWNNARIEHRLQEQEKLLMAARLSALANQINPHFLFNTLASIASLVRSQPETARMVIHRLSALLRRLMRSQDHFVVLREELLSIDDYLDIEVIRFGPQLRVQKEIDPGTLDVLVPSMILQPIVENSIKHGLSRKVGGGRILIRTRRRNGAAVIEIVDDGLGMTPERLREAFQGGIGLSNVSERLRVIYGERCQVQLESTLNQGTSVTMEIPTPPRRRSAPVPDQELKAVVVDDEPLAREEICYLLDQMGGIEVIAQAGNGPDAVEIVTEHEPDLVFLDVQMPGLTGFQVARRLVDSGTTVSIVFVTAYDQHAIEAFEVNAVDYLLKPVDGTRLETAVHRVRQRRATARPLNDQLERIVQFVEERQGRREQVAVKVGERFLLVQADDIIFASMADESINIVTSQISGTCNFRTLDELQARLDPARFWRVHRSHLVNINKIKEIVPWFSRNYILRMKDAKATEIPVSRSQTRRLREYLKL